jgi:hypothetical protein
MILKIRLRCALTPGATGANRCGRSVAAGTISQNERQRSQWFARSARSNINPEMRNDPNHPAGAAQARRSSLQSNASCPGCLSVPVRAQPNRHGGVVFNA